jgi:hypothetical protein
MKWTRSGFEFSGISCFADSVICHHYSCARQPRGAYKRKSKTGGVSIPQTIMISPPGLTALLAVGLLGQRVVATPSSVSRSDSSVSPLLVSPSPAVLNPFEFPWGSCESFGVNSTNPSFQCGYLEVPMDYHDSSAGNARLAVIKYAATAEKLGTLFFNPGERIRSIPSLSPF